MINSIFLKHFLFDTGFRNAQLLASKRFSTLFPSLYHKIEESHYVLTERNDCTRYNKIHLILRTTDAVMNVNQSRQLEEIGIHSKQDVINLCVESVARAVATFQKKHGTDSISVTVVADRLSQNGKNLYAKMFSNSNMRFVESLPGNSNTFRKQIEIARDDRDDTLIAVYEDDYLTEEQTFCIAFDLFNAVQKLEGFTPHNHPAILRNALSTRLYFLKNQYYKLTKTTTCTFITGADLIKKHLKKFLRYDGYEGLSINKVWEKEICLAPCGWTLSEHLHRCDLSPCQTLIKNHFPIF